MSTGQMLEASYLSGTPPDSDLLAMLHALQDHSAGRCVVCNRPFARRKCGGPERIYCDDRCKSRRGWRTLKLRLARRGQNSYAARLRRRPF